MSAPNVRILAPGSDGSRTTRRRRNSRDLSNTLPALLEKSLEMSKGVIAGRGVFGSIRFPSNLSGIPAKFVTVPVVEKDEKDSDDTFAEKRRTQADHAVDLMLNTWKLPPPCAMISIPEVREPMEPLGDATHLRLVLSRGIAEAVHKTNAWVFTSGLSDDVGAELAGLAQAHGISQIPGFRGPMCLGLTASNLLAEQKKLKWMRNGMVHSWASDAVFGGDDRGKSPSPEASPRLESVMHIDDNTKDLEPHHTHFLISDGSRAASHDFRMEVGFRAIRHS